MDIYDFVCKNDVDFAAHLPNKELISDIEKALEIKFGEQTQELFVRIWLFGI